MQQALQRSRGLQPVGVAIPSTSLRLRSSHTCRRGSPPGPHQPQRVTPVQGMRRSPVITPDITLGSGDEEQSVGLFQYLLSQRIIFCGGYIDDKMCTKIVGSLMALDAASQTEEIRLYINSPGGSPYAVLGLVDTLQTIKAPVQTLALGACYSYASLVLAAGNKGKRLAMKNTRIMMTQPMGGSQGDWWQVSKTVEELNALYQLFAR